MKPRLLVVDDDEGIRTQLKWGLAQDYDVYLAENRETAIDHFRQQSPPVVLLDLGLPPHPASSEEGLAILAEIVALDRHVKVIIVSGQGEKANALQAIGAGAYDFLSKPVDLDELKVILRRTFHVASLERDYRLLQQQTQSESFEGMLGSSTAMQGVFNSIRKVATTNAPVLILGESGTGKERVAMAIHRRGPRKDGPFVAINCSAIPEALLESELFGHEKGSFTGAHMQRKGRIESASGGTLFLDEIGEIPLALQVKLLRFLQEQRIERIGGRQEIEVDTRVIAATNSDLRKGMLEGKFREDLFYRIAVVVITLPPLRDREGDARLLAQEFLRRSATEHGKSGLVFEKDALKSITAYPWPGNVRELENRVKRAVIMADHKRLTAEDLELSNQDGLFGATTLKEAREAVERKLITASLKKHGGKITAVANELGVSRPTLYELMEKLGITKDHAPAETGGA